MHTEQRERPILFSAPMVRAILSGRKTQTRRVVNARHLLQIDTSKLPGRVSWTKPDPYGRPGDRLYVRETWRASSAHNSLAPREIPVGDGIEYAADPERILTGKTRTAIHMPRWASRITLEVTGVRVERLKDICDADAIAEGCPGGHGSIPGYGYAALPTEHFYSLWESIN
ncbi:MAG: hypothetical protein ACRC2X_15525, partial [Giesbergeria sp.]